MQLRWWTECRLTGDCVGLWHRHEHSQVGSGSSRVFGWFKVRLCVPRVCGVYVFRVCVAYCPELVRVCPRTAWVWLQRLENQLVSSMHGKELFSSLCLRSCHAWGDWLLHGSLAPTGCGPSLFDTLLLRG